MPQPRVTITLGLLRRLIDVSDALATQVAAVRYTMWDRSNDGITLRPDPGLEAETIDVLLQDTDAILKEARRQRTVGLKEKTA